MDHLTSSASSPFVTDAAGDLVLHFNDKQESVSEYFRVSTDKLRKRSGFFDVLLDPEKFREGRTFQYLSAELHMTHRETSAIPSQDLPQITVHEIGQISNRHYTGAALALFLDILHNDPLTWPSSNTKLYSIDTMAVLAAISDRFAATSTVAPLIRQSQWRRVMASRRGAQMSTLDRETLNRQRIYIGYIFGIADWVYESSKRLVLDGSRIWIENDWDEEMPRSPWWSLPYGLEGNTHIELGKEILMTD